MTTDSAGNRVGTVGKQQNDILQTQINIAFYVRKGKSIHYKINSIQETA